MNKIIFRLIPLGIFLILAIVLWRGLSLDPHRIPSVLINQEVPSFKMQTLSGKPSEFSHRDLLGKVSLVHVWATWCLTCKNEQPILMDIAESNIPIYGIDYKDDAVKAKRFIQRYGDPYQLIGLDVDGSIAINLGVYGTPETFIVDRKGVIRYKHIGPMTMSVWNETLLPIIRKLQVAKS